jgi:hypothetical protein
LTASPTDPRVSDTELTVIVRRLLDQCPGEPLCDACLAFACSVSLSEMRVVTIAVGLDMPFVRDTATCTSCRRQTTTLCLRKHTIDAKCAHCSRLIDPTEDVEVVDSDRFHHLCWIRLTSAESVRTARALSRRSQELIRKSRELMGLSPLEHGPPGI